MDTTYKPSKALNLTAVILIIIGVLAVITGFLSDPSRTWSNLLVNNFYFLTISVGAMMFYSLQFITGSTWSALLQRIPLSMSAYIGVSAVFMLLMYFGLQNVYEWAIPNITETDKLIAHKAPFLNVPFYMLRILVYFALWIPLVVVLWRLAQKEDLQADLRHYQRAAHFSKVFIFVIALFFSFAAIDWIMTIDSHWYSTLFGFRAMVTSIYFGVAATVLVIFFLRSKGYLQQINQAHRHDLARYLFRFSIVFGYLWFMQFLILWYANIPELTVYYKPRFLGEWQFFFYAEIIINFAIPFVVMMADQVGRKRVVLISMSILLLLGLWISIFLQVMPGSYGPLRIGFTEIGMFLGFAGLFILLLFHTLGRLKLVPVNHPYLEESIHHHL
jgi:hypothetical protein